MHQKKAAIYRYSAVTYWVNTVAEYTAMTMQSNTRTNTIRPRLKLLLAAFAALGLTSCGQPPAEQATAKAEPEPKAEQTAGNRQGKPVVYQVFTLGYPGTKRCWQV